jgi:type IV secretory pathway component VirB8
MTESESQNNAKRGDAIQAAHGGRQPEYVTMTLTSDLERSTRRLVYLTRWLIALTIVLAVLTTAQVALIICMEIRSFAPVQRLIQA